MPVETKRRLFTVSGIVLFINEQEEGKAGKKKQYRLKTCVVSLICTWCKYLDIFGLGFFFFLWTSHAHTCFYSGGLYGLEVT